MFGGDGDVEMADGGRAADAADANDRRSDRQRAVDAAVVALRRALGGFGAAYLQQVERWADGLEPSAPTLARLPYAVKKAAQRLPKTPPSVCEAHGAFVRSVDAARHLAGAAAGPD